MSGCCGQGPVIVSGAAATPRVDVETVLLCDVLPDGTVAGVALVEPIYDTISGDRVGTRTVDPVTGAAYTPTGTLGPCSPDGCNATTAALVLCDVAGDGTATAFVRTTTYDCEGALLATLDRSLDGTPYTVTGTVGVCPTSPDCESPTTPVTSVGLCLADGTPIAVTVVRDCTGAVTSEGWINLSTGAWSAGAVPAGTVACGESRSIQVSGTFCDVDDATGDILGLVLVEYTYDDTGAVASVRLVDAVTGGTYTPAGTVTVCPAGVEQPERDLVQLCDTATDGTVTPFVRDYGRDENGAIVGHSDYGLDGAPYTPAGTVGVCTQPCRSTSVIALCDTTPSGPIQLAPRLSYTNVDPMPWIIPGEGVIHQPSLVSGQPFWDGGTIVVAPPPGGEAAEPTHRVIAAQIGVEGAAQICNPPENVTLTLTCHIVNEGPAAGQATCGRWHLHNGATVVANEAALSVSVGGFRDMSITGSVPWADLLAGNVHIAMDLETAHFGLKSWTCSDFAVTVTPTEVEPCDTSTGETVPFLRAVVTDCATGEIQSTVDTTLDGAPYTVAGTVGQCASGTGSSSECSGCTSVVLCDTAEDAEPVPFLRTVCQDCTGAVVSTLDTELDGTTPYVVVGTVGSCGPDSCPTTSVETIRLCDLDPSVEADEEGRRCAVPFLRHLAYDCNGDLLTFHDTGLDGTTPYTPVQVVDCQCTSGQGITASIEVPWTVVGVVEDPAGLPQQDFIYTVAPETDPTRLGTIRVHVSRPAGPPCAPYDINALVFSNTAAYTLTLDAVAQEMSYLRVDLVDFDSFEPVAINTAYPLPSRLGGTAGWNATNTRIVPSENDGTGYIYWDNPPETVGWSVLNQGGGTSCSALSFQGMTVEPGGCCGGSEGGCSDCGPVETGVRSVTGTAPQDLVAEFPDLQSVSLAVLAGAVNVTMTDGTDVAIPAGVTLTWSVAKDTDTSLAAALFTGTDASANYLLNWTNS